MDEGRTGWRSEFRVRTANFESRVYSILACSLELGTELWWSLCGVRVDIELETIEEMTCRLLMCEFKTSEVYLRRLILYRRYVRLHSKTNHSTAMRICLVDTMRPSPLENALFFLLC